MKSKKTIKKMQHGGTPPVTSSYDKFVGPKQPKVLSSPSKKIEGTTPPMKKGGIVKKKK